MALLCVLGAHTGHPEAQNNVDNSFELSFFMVSIQYQVCNGLIFEAVWRVFSQESLINGRIVQSLLPLKVSIIYLFCR